MQRSAISLLLPELLFVRSLRTCGGRLESNTPTSFLGRRLLQRSYRFRYQRVSFSSDQLSRSTPGEPPVPVEIHPIIREAPIPIETHPALETHPSLEIHHPLRLPEKERERRETKRNTIIKDSPTGVGQILTKKNRCTASACSCQSTMLYHTMSENKGIVPQGMESRKGRSWRANVVLSCVGFLACLFPGSSIFGKELG